MKFTMKGKSFHYFVSWLDQPHTRKIATRKVVIFMKATTVWPLLLETPGIHFTPGKRDFGSISWKTPGKNIIFQIYVFYHIEYSRAYRKL